MIVMAETEYDKIVDRALDDLSDQVEDSKIEHKKSWYIPGRGAKQ